MYFSVGEGTSPEKYAFCLITCFYLFSFEPDCEKKHHFVIELGPRGEKDAGGNVGLKRKEKTEKTYFLLNAYIKDNSDVHSSTCTMHKLNACFEHNSDVAAQKVQACFSSLWLLLRNIKICLAYFENPSDVGRKVQT